MAQKKPAKGAKGKSGSRSDGASAGASEPYVVLARKYRPQTFDDLIGQDAMVATLRNAFDAGRIAQGYMLTGVRGVGKTTTARILARALNFEGASADNAPTVDLPKGSENYGSHCAQIMESRHPDVIEMDAASNTGIDNIREIIESARYKPLVARYKVFIIDEVHMLSKGAFNALLKTLEEPPEHVKFIFATTEIRKVPVTVLSRCQRFDLRRVDVPQLAEHFKRISEKEGAKASGEALALIARAAEGSVRDGLSILDQAIAYSQGDVSAENVRAMLGLADRGRIFDLLDQLFAGQTAQALNALSALHSDGAEPVQVLSDLAEAVHLITRIKAAGSDAGGEGLSAEEKRRAGSLADSLSVPLLSRAWQMLLKGLEEVGRAPQPLAAADMVLIRMAHTADLPSPDELIRMLGGESRPAGKGAPATSGGSKAAKAEATAQAPVQPEQEAQVAAVSREPTERDAPVASLQDDQTAPVASEAGLSLDDVPPWEGYDAPEGSGEFDADDPVNTDAMLAMSPPVPPDPRSFGEVLQLVGNRRDAKLKVHLEEHVSLVNFDAAAGSIDLFLLPGAPPEIANALRERLNRWTQRRWVVVLSKTAGEPAVAEVRRQRQKAELEALKAEPEIGALFDVFPGAKVVEVRSIGAAAQTDDGSVSDGSASPEDEKRARADNSKAG